MITREGKLDILERFEVDRNLPKHRAKRRPLVGDVMEGGFSFNTNSVRAMSLVTVAAPPTWYQRIMAAVLKLKPAEPPEGGLSVAEFFHSVKNSAEEVQIVDARLAGYAKALQDAERNGQTVLHERLARDVAAVRAETQLHAVGFAKYVSEENLVRFVKESKRGLRLDYIRNFMRVIPPDVAAKKARCDEVEAFDNYAILHYDPEGKAWAETEEEKARRRDPILFGLIEGRRRLYYVADWVDELCDLTLEQVADLLGEGGVSEIPAEYKVPPLA